MISQLRADPTWSEELTAALTECIAKCKAQLIDFAANAIQSGAVKPRVGARFELHLLLDERSLEKMLPDQAARVRQIVAETQADIEALLTDEQRQTFGKMGLRDLFLHLDDGMWRAAFMRRLNGLPAIGQGVREDYREFFCSKPFEYADINDKGALNLCCALWLPEDAGDYQSGSFMEVWNSRKAQAIRQSILDGSYSHCVEQHCPHLQNKTLPKRHEVTDPVYLDIIENNRTALEHGPRSLTFSYDKSCNLACPTCRVGPIMVTGDAKTKAEQIQDWASGEHLKDVERLDITLSGDAFGSAVFFKFLRDFDASAYPNLRITLCTNGLLFTERNWDRICKTAVDVVYISIDAATPETYAINRGGDFSLLLENLHFVGQLRTSGALKQFTISFVVQANNFREMPAFAALGKSVNADNVLFIQVGNPGVFSTDEFQRRAVHLPSHPEHHDLLEVLRDPKLDLPGVDLRNYSGLRPSAAPVSR